MNENVKTKIALLLNLAIKEARLLRQRMNVVMCELECDRKYLNRTVLLHAQSILYSQCRFLYVLFFFILCLNSTLLQTLTKPFGLKNNERREKSAAHAYLDRFNCSVGFFSLCVSVTPSLSFSSWHCLRESRPNEIKRIIALTVNTPYIVRFTKQPQWRHR